ncbi:MAG: gfo/Idh/MocA family oxidoreductase [Desulfobacteraceae bacterium]|nr:MAG: gfo/Idh/MocA family oxidoreductase [Desulfobacteraceae bacterium]
MRTVYKAAIVGLGNIAWRFDCHKPDLYTSRTHASSYMNNHRINLIGGCSPNEADRKEFEEFFRVPSFPEFEELIESVKPDVVSICSPPENHFKQVKYCLANGIPMIWLEKPPALSLQELDNLIEEQSKHRNRSTILVNYQRRYSDPYFELKSLYENGLFGKCVMIQINYSRGLETNGSHVIDMLFYIVGNGLEYEVNQIMTFRETSSPSFSLAFKNGIEVMVSGMALPYHCIDIALIFESGRASILYGGATMMLEKKIENEEYPGFYRLKNEKITNFEQGGFHGSMDRALSDLIECHEGKNFPVSNLMTARNAQSVMHQVREKQGSSHS